jgi:YopT-type cysteine protease-like protein
MEVSMLGCTAYGGMVDGEMQQGSSNYGYINLDPGTREGGCWALSNMWIVNRTSPKSSFADYLAWISRPSGVKLMNNSQVEMSKRKSGGESSKIYHRQWLQKFGFTIAGDLELDWPLNVFQSEGITKDGGFKFLNLQFNRGGHATACQIHGGRATFFDPNYGQATFGSESNFRRWLVEKLLPQYHHDFGLQWFRVSSLRGGAQAAKRV